MDIEEIFNLKFSSESQKAVVNLRYTANYFGNLQSQFIEQFDLSMQQFNILRILRGAKESLNVSVIRDRMVEKSPNTTRLLDKLMDKKLLERERNITDRRIIKVSISELGLQKLAEIDKVPNLQSYLDFTNNISEEDAKSLNRILDKFRG
jgi:MarR family transcriptional regulator, 2-MHQ and catechol-resistance regulon repressor